MLLRTDINLAVTAWAHTHILTSERGLSNICSDYTLPDSIGGLLEDLGLEVGGQLRIDGQYS